MALTHIYEDGGGVVLIGSGVLSGQEVIRVNSAMYATPELVKAIRYQICDFCAVEGLDISTDELRIMAGQDVRAAEINRGMLLAIAASRDLTFGTARVWHAYAENSHLRAQVFRTVEECRAWVESSLR